MTAPALAKPRRTLSAAAPARAPAVRSVPRILLVDDHPLMRRGIRTLIEQDAHYEVCAEADNPAQALEFLRQYSPSLCIVDITLQSTNGIELIKSLRAEQPDLLVLVVSMHDEEIYAERALRAGASGYVMKHEAGDRLLAAMKRALEGEIYISDRLRERMLQRFVQGGEGTAAPTDVLSDREMEVFQLFGVGYGTRAIATQLNLSVKTIDSYREHLKVKLNLKSSADLLRYAIQWTKSQPSS